MQNNPVLWQQAVTAFAETLENAQCTGLSGNKLTLDAGFSLWLELAGFVREREQTIYLAGNGASASMASHYATDLAKNAVVRTQVFTEPAQVTALGNDIGFEQVFAFPLKRFARPGEMFIAISSSGASPNILAACRAARENGLCIVTLSGFSPENPLRSLGDLNFYVPATTYGITETCHAAILHYWMDGMSASK